MGVKRRRSKRRPDLSDNEENWLRGLPSGFVQFKGKDQLAELWQQNRDRIVAEHIAHSPGTRPVRWWEYDAPEPLGEDESETEYLSRHGFVFGGELTELPADAPERV